ncbi:ABC transporter ATP-binding protein [Hoeflea ulvae]|uniref:ABC transporter ATP-binding protein n=1 Tax=Hoeflea ulvae TaxID=2983764 RepID=A0ABT3YCX2_9HYPH|nr:ABC transporter ATP-binding protein [Hoeflea ulvae]MCY0093629.1 ABC transporter ATP-binding protein [Hoeflea ulvae]
MVATMIAAQALGFRHSDTSPWLFENLSFSLQPGQTLALLGRNGRGKTTLLKCLAELIRPTAGTISSDGPLGYVPQHFVTPFAYSVFDVVLMGRARHIGMFSNPSAQDRLRTAEVLELVGLSAFSGRAIGTLSGGERQLALIARALASEADILLLDEPASALDFHNQALVLSMLRRLSAQRGLTILMTTHEPTHALQIADRAVFLYGSGKVEEGAIDMMCTEEKLSELYSLSMKRLDYPTGGTTSSNIVADYASMDR